MSEAIRPYVVRVAEDVLVDLRRRIASTRWPDQLEGVGWDYGAPLEVVQELARYWCEEYDWRRAEVALNGFPHFATTIDGANIHFIHARSPEPDAFPLVVSHGWPGSVVEFLDIIEPLRDPRSHGADPSQAFHVVCPSLPGYGFSGPTRSRGWDVRRTGRAFATLMGRLGYARYGAQGGDWGSLISQWIAREDPEHCAAIHLNLLFTSPPADGAAAELDPAEQAALARSAEYQASGSGYAQIQGTKPQTLAYGMHDSPVALLAWIAEKFQAWTDCAGVIENAVSRDALLTNVTVYWVTQTSNSSFRMYYESMQGGNLLPPSIPVPVGVASFPMEILASPRRWCEQAYDVVHWTDMPRGGHFAAMEEPELLVGDLRAFFRRFRPAGVSSRG